MVVVRKGDPAPKTGSSTAVFTSLSDPVCDGTGHVAFAAKIMDGRVPGSGLWTNLSGSLQQVALVGGTDTGITGAHYSALTSYVMCSAGTIFYTGTFAVGARVAGTAVWAFDADGPHLLLKTGDFAGSSRILTITALTSIAGSPGQGRGYRETDAVARVTLADVTTALIHLSTQAAPIVMAKSPLPLSIHPPITLVQTLASRISAPSAPAPSAAPPMVFRSSSRIRPPAASPPWLAVAMTPRHRWRDVPQFRRSRLQRAIRHRLHRHRLPRRGQCDEQLRHLANLARRRHARARRPHRPGAARRSRGRLEFVRLARLAG